MREPGVRCDANITLRDCGRRVATGYDVDKRLHLGFPVFDLETVQDRALAIARPASREEVNGGCCMASTLGPIDDPEQQVSVLAKLFVLLPDVQTKIVRVTKLRGKIDGV